MKTSTRILIVVCLLAAGFALAGAAYAGGWATIGITQMPQEIVAGRPFTIEFMVWQHGNKAVHDLYWDNNERIPITPVVLFAAAGAGQKLVFEAAPGKEPGLFAAEITLPAAGDYAWAIAPEPLQGVTELDPLTVAAAGAAASVQAAPAAAGGVLAGTAVPALAAGMFLALAAAGLVLRRRPTIYPGRRS